MNNVIPDSPLFYSPNPNPSQPQGNNRFNPLTTAFSFPLYQTNLPPTQAHADSTYSDKFKADNAVDSDPETYWSSIKTIANLFLYFTNGSTNYPIYISNVSIRSFANFDTTFSYEILGIAEGSNKFASISQVEQRDVPAWTRGAERLPPIHIPNPANTLRYTAIQIRCRDLNSISRVFIHDVEVNN